MASERISFEMSYDYSVNENDYSSSRITMAASDQINERPKVGEEITIYYDPNHPEQATWIKGAPGRSIGLICVGYLLAGIGIWILFSILLSLRPKSEMNEMR